MSWKTKIKDVLRDPAWASIRAIIAFLALLASPLVLWYFTTQPTPKTSISSNKLMIYEASSKNLTDIPHTIAERTRILIDGKDEKDVKLYEFLVEFQGVHPIRASDFEVPIRGEVPTGRKILAVQQSKKTAWIPKRIGKTGHVEGAVEPQIHCEIRKVDDDTFEVTPLLINPNDWFSVEVYTATVTSNKTPESTSTTQVQLGPEISWSCRVAGVQCPTAKDYDAFPEFSKPPNPFEIQLSAYSGWSVYFLILFTISNLVILLALSRRTQWVVTSPTLKLFLFAIAVFLSMATSEVLADWWFNGHHLEHQPFAASLLLYLDLGIVILLLAIVVARRKLITTS